MVTQVEPPEQQPHVMQSRFPNITDAVVSGRGRTMDSQMQPTRLAATISQTSPSFSRSQSTGDNNQEAQAKTLLATGSQQITDSVTLLLLLFLLSLMAVLIYSLFRRIWNKFACPRFPSCRGDVIGQEKRKQLPLVVVLANALAKPDVQLLNRVRRRFVDEEYAANYKEALAEEASASLVPERGTTTGSLIETSAQLHRGRPQIEQPKESNESVISNEQTEGDESCIIDNRKQANLLTQPCHVCGAKSEELEERCHSHSPRASNLGFEGRGELTGGWSVSPILLNCQRELGDCRLMSGRQPSKLANRRLLRQTNHSSEHRSSRLFYEDYYDDEDRIGRAHAYERLELEVEANSKCLQQSGAQELMELAQSEQSLNSNNPNKSLSMLKNKSSNATANDQQQPQQQLLVSSSQLRPNGSDGELASSTSTSLGGSDSGFVACVACQAGSTRQESKQVEPRPTTETEPAKPIVGKSCSAGKWRRNQRQHLDKQRTIDLEATLARAHRRMSIAGDQICGHPAVRSTNGFQSHSPQILQRYTRRPSDTYLYGHEPATGDDGYNKSVYSSSGGSSSGIGVSGSACTNTPTTRAFPYSSFVDADSTKMAYNLVSGHPLYPTNLYHNNNAVVANLLAQQDDASIGTGSSPASRKYSLPVQLEWQANERLSPKCTRLLFDRNLQQATIGQQLTEDSVGASIASSLRRAEETRRSSQTITRQSSFWLADQSDDSVLSLANIEAPLFGYMEEPLRQQQLLNSSSVDQPLAQPPPEPAPQPSTRSARASLSSIAVLSGDSIESVKKRPLFDTCSASLEQSTEPQEKDKPTVSSGQISARNSSSTPTSNGCSPSPPDSIRPSNRMLASRTGGFIRRSKLKTKRHQKSEDFATKRRRAFKMRSGIQQHSAPNPSKRTKDEEWDENDDDDEEIGCHAHIAMMHADCPFGPMQSTCSLPQHIRKAGANSYEGNSITKLTSRPTRTDKKDSPNLERQCRELWKLRATLHDDSCISDNWANYHQRLNRRYDSGYRSIEHQFSSSFEGPVRASAGAQANSASLDGPRPPSSCSNQQPTTTTNQVENKMSQLALAEDQKDTPTSEEGERDCHSRNSKCSSGSSNENDNNEM